ncbi:MAG: tetratricopeptide repeat protein [Candidatus Eremiobacteraeota bacterium]|nr:tetratricopeptide repeat protein [Candidatus Eremiobacteraeota bacterium]
MTITGVGGVGKTRAAIELSRTLAEDFEEGPGFVSLAAIRDPAHVAPALGQILESKDQEDSVTFDALCARIGTRRALIVIDNFEHLLESAPLLVDLLDRCPRAALVVTSREALRVTGEHEFYLPPLRLADAVDLFIDRSLAIKPDVETDADQDSVVSICRRLDGLPLAIELAAARLRHYPLAVLVGRLSSRLDALTAGARDAPLRQRTMRDAIDWSYQLLTDDERTAFQMTALFAGGGTLEAFEAIAKALGRDYSADLIASLADKNLLGVYDDAKGGARFELLETIREFAHEQLVSSGRMESLQRAFAAYYSDLVHRAAPHLRGSEASEWSDSIAREYENVRTSLRFALAYDRPLGFLLTMDLRHFWSRMGYFTEGREWLEALGDPRDHAAALTDAKTVWELLNLRALSYHWMYDDERAKPLFTEVLEFARSLGDDELVARSLNNLGGTLRTLNEVEESRALHEEALAIKERQGDPWWIATSLSNLGLALRSCGQTELALERHHRALELFRVTEDRWGEIATFNDLGDDHRNQGEYRVAATLYKASLDGNEGFRTLAADSFEGLATVAASGGRFRQAAVLGGASDAIHRELRRPIALPDRPQFDAACDSARSALGTEEFDLAWAEGASLSLREAIAVGRGIASEHAQTQSSA